MKINANKPYQWQVCANGSWVDIASATNADYTIANVQASMAHNQYRVLLTSPCGTSIASGAATLGVNPLPVVSIASAQTVLNPTDKTSITASASPAGGIYAWYKNDVQGTTGYSPSLQNISVDSVGNYKLTYTDANGCSSASNIINISPTSGLHDMLRFPNPNSGRFSIRAYATVTQVPLNVQVIDMTGNIVYKSKAVISTPYEKIDIAMSNSASRNYKVIIYDAHGLLIGVKSINIIR